MKAFKRITLKVGEKKMIQLKVKADDLLYWDENLHRFVLENDTIKVMVGSSSSEIKFQDIVTVK